jgi:uncharacterized Tic20 family protein
LRRSGANLALFLGLLSLVFGLLGPFAIWTAVRALRRVRHASGAAGESRAQLGLVLGLLSTLFMVAGIARFVTAS